MNEGRRIHETIRHGAKEGKELSEEGREQAHNKGDELFDRLSALPEGAVMVIYSSPIGRAKDTASIATQQMKERASTEEGFEFISVHDVEKIETLADRFDGKFVITDIHPQTLAGFKREDPSSQAFVDYQDRFNGDEEFVGQTWLATSKDTEDLRQRAKEAFPGIDPSTINPADFGDTPEDMAAKGLKLLRRIDQLAEKYFPEHEFSGVTVSHNAISDFMVMAAADLPLTNESMKQFGSDFRHPIEGSTVEIQNDRLIVRYRDVVHEVETTIDELLERLKVQSEARKEDWASIDS